MGSNSGIKLNITGFENLLEQIQQADGNINSATEQALNESAAVVAEELRSAATSAGVPASVVNAIKQDAAKWNGNKCSVSVGWKLGTFDPRNPSQGYKALFANYGTPHRQEHGKVKGQFFITDAKKRASKRVKKIQKQTLENILKGLEK